MCDTQVIRQGGSTFFAKNSDRESSEPQYIVRVPAVAGDSSTQLNTTYLCIPQVPNRHGLILSKPSWIWGAEIGANDQGVVIGNEAVFSRLAGKKTKGLLGMDLLRLGLERGASAMHALRTITKLLEKYGQGGAAGFRDKNFCYDNSFIICDAQEAWVLETAGRCWVAKRVHEYAAISNYYSIECEFDLASDGLQEYARKNGNYDGKSEFNFAKAFDTRFMTFMGKAKQRRALSMQSLTALNASGQASLGTMVNSLRRHHHDGDDFAQHSNRDVCMHGAGVTRPSQTCGSMVVKLQADTLPEILVTGTSAPCLSLFKPISFDQSVPFGFEFDANGSEKSSHWFEFEWVHRRALMDLAFRTALQVSRDEIEKAWLQEETGTLDLQQANDAAMRWHAYWVQESRKKKPKYSRFNAYQRYWKKLNTLDGII